MVDENRPSQGWLPKIENPWKLLALALVLTQAATLYFLFSGNNLTGLAPLPKPVGDGKVAVVEYSDFQCPYCARFETETYPQLKKDYIDTGKIEFQYKHFPLSQIHPNAQIAAEASECARDQGKFEEYRAMLFRQQGDWANLADPTAKFGEYASQLGINGSGLVACAKSGEKAEIVKKDFDEGTALGVTGTPTFYINGKMVTPPGAIPYSQIKQQLDSAGAASSGTTPEKPEPEVRLTIINDSTCAACSTAQAEAVLKSQLFPTLAIERVEFLSDRGQALYNELQFKTLPAYLFGDSVEESYNFLQLQAVSNRTPKGYLLSASALGVGKVIKPINVEGKHSLGDENAPVTIIEFSDFQCPYCGKFYTETEKQLIQEYVDSGKAKFVFLHFPLNGHPLAQPAAEASECAAEQGKFWEFHDLAFEQQEKLSESQLKLWAKELGLDEAKFNECYNSGKYSGKVEEEFNLGVELGVNATPAFYVNGTYIRGAQPFNSFRPVIESALNAP